MRNKTVKESNCIDCGIAIEQKKQGCRKRCDSCVRLKKQSVFPVEGFSRKTFDLPEPLLFKLSEHCKKNKRTQVFVIREALERYLEES